MIGGRLGRETGPLPEPLARALSFLERENPGGLDPGRYAVLSPDDLHCPLRASHRTAVKKVVVKVARDFFKEER